MAGQFPDDLLDLSNIPAPDDDDWNSIQYNVVGLHSPRASSTPRGRASQGPRTPPDNNGGSGSFRSLSTHSSFDRPSPRSLLSTSSRSGTPVLDKSPRTAPTGVGVGSSGPPRSPQPGPSGIATRVGGGTTGSAGRLLSGRFVPPSGKRLPGRSPPITAGSFGKQPRRGRGRGRGGGGGGSSDSSSSSSTSRRSNVSSRGGRRTRMSQEELRRQLQLLSQDQVQQAAGRRIAGVTTTNTVTTTYKDGGRPSVSRNSSTVSN